MLSKAGGGCDGTIDYRGFVNLMSGEHSQEISRATLNEYFGILDRDGSGYITTAELRHDLTSLHQSLSDEDMNQIMNSYDLDGNGQLTLPEFEALVQDNGLKVVEGGEEEPHAAELFEIPASERQTEPADEPVAVSDPRLAEALKPLANEDGKLRLSDVSRAVEVWQRCSGVRDTRDPEGSPSLHWEKGRVKRGLGEVIYKANHIALIVSDVGRSAAFYSDVIGLQQIRRPDFDRHGAWFTMGNMELHLIKGEPVVHSGRDLIVGHISIETYDIDRVPKILKELGVPFRQNVSVPKGKMAQGSGTNASNTSSNIVKQYFLRDPDGYYLEICNCDVLTKYCLGDAQEVAGYDHGVALDCHDSGVFVGLGIRVAHHAHLRQKEMAKLAVAMKGRRIAEIARRLGCKTPAAEVDEEKLRKLMVRRSVYGDVCQNETEESLREILLATSNHVPLAMKVMEVRAGDSQTLAPPAFFEGGTTKVVPEPFRMSKSGSEVDKPVPPRPLCWGGLWACLRGSLRA
uniref:Calmodulin n=1 Tax=Alexandrium monilatum TaxID=311494 RepID=A0A7S4S3T5_9DINO